MAKYAKRLEVANVLFALFAMSFFLCRIVYFPYWLAKNLFQGIPHFCVKFDFEGQG